MAEKHVLAKIVDACDWWSRRRDRWPSTREAFQKFDLIWNRETLVLLSDWWTVAEEIYASHLTRKRELTSKDDVGIATLMGSLIYSEYGEEPNGRILGTQLTTRDKM